MVALNAAVCGPLVRRKAAFRALVEAQDRGLSVADSRRAVGEEFGLTADQVRAVEDEGVEGGWPPL